MTNLVKQNLEKGNVSVGVFLLCNNSMIAEALAVLPIDWIIIDMEASVFSKEDVLHILQSVKGSSVTPMIRISEQNKHLIEFGLDLGAKGILIPKIDTKAQVQELIRYFYYPPKGIRGVNPVRVSNYFENLEEHFSIANDNVLSMVQIESKESVDEIDKIAQVSELDVLFIGCGDLASSFGQIGNVTGQKMDIARGKVLEACKKYNKIAGIFAYSTELANQYIEEGFKFIAIGNDIKFLKQGLINSLSNLKL